MLPIQEKFIKKISILWFRYTGIREIPEGEAPFPEAVPRMVNTDFEIGCLGLEALLLRCPLLLFHQLTPWKFLHLPHL